MTLSVEAQVLLGYTSCTMAAALQAVRFVRVPLLNPHILVTPLNLAAKLSDLSPVLYGILPWVGFALECATYALLPVTAAVPMQTTALTSLVLSQVHRGRFSLKHLVGFVAAAMAWLLPLFLPLPHTDFRMQPFFDHLLSVWTVLYVLSLLALATLIHRRHLVSSASLPLPMPSPSGSPKDRNKRHLADANSMDAGSLFMATLPAAMNFGVAVIALTAVAHSVGSLLVSGVAPYPLLVAALVVFFLTREAQMNSLERQIDAIAPGHARSLCGSPVPQSLKSSVHQSYAYQRPMHQPPQDEDLMTTGLDGCRAGFAGGTNPESLFSIWRTHSTVPQHGQALLGVFFAYGMECCLTGCTTGLLLLGRTVWGSGRSTTDAVELPMRPKGRHRHVAGADSPRSDDDQLLPQSPDGSSGSTRDDLEDRLIQSVVASAAGQQHDDPFKAPQTNPFARGPSSGVPSITPSPWAASSNQWIAARNAATPDTNTADPATMAVFAAFPDELAPASHPPAAAAPPPQTVSPIPPPTQPAKPVATQAVHEPAAEGKRTDTTAETRAATADEEGDTHPHHHSHHAETDTQETHHPSSAFLQADEEGSDTGGGWGAFATATAGRGEQHRGERKGQVLMVTGEAQKKPLLLSVDTSTVPSLLGLGALDKGGCNSPDDAAGKGGLAGGGGGGGMGDDSLEEEVLMDAIHDVM
ncbi:unnamed protein product [Vitrella brassicaformis CCMP3155]|uniref:Uncharacterized protein n=2 Tax=Vitrella brassicaformis TaxID=1169539 RepID=A0A0G4EPR5_VITBC|nr:unnamed protein product [Vitrella brassicaformis CCMP3155]|eukprot:CEL99430.1 unnamed protein product [Vitrella brassicaformis CCMP3155]